MKENELRIAMDPENRVEEQPDNRPHLEAKSGQHTDGEPLLTYDSTSPDLEKLLTYKVKIMNTMIESKAALREAHQKENIRVAHERWRKAQIKAALSSHDSAREAHEKQKLARKNKEGFEDILRQHIGMVAAHRAAELLVSWQRTVSVLDCGTPAERKKRETAARKLAEDAVKKLKQAIDNITKEVEDEIQIVSRPLEILPNIDGCVDTKIEDHHNEELQWEKRVAYLQEWQVEFESILKVAKQKPLQSWEENPAHWGDRREELLALPWAEKGNLHMFTMQKRIGSTSVHTLQEIVRQMLSSLNMLHKNVPTCLIFVSASTYLLVVLVRLVGNHMRTGC